MAKKTSKRRPTAAESTARRTKQPAAAPRSGPALRGPARDLPDYVLAQVFGPTSAQRRVRGKQTGAKTAANLSPTPPVEEKALPREVRATTESLTTQRPRFHGAKLSLAWFPWRRLASECADQFGYLTPKLLRKITSLPFNATTIDLMDRLGAMMGDPGRETSGDSAIPAGFTYVGQFVDHDITFDMSSSLETLTNAETIHNMRSPALDLDSVYGDGPALQPFLYAFPQPGDPPTAIKLQLGSNQDFGDGGSSSDGTPNGMKTLTNFDLPRIHNPIDPGASTLTAVIGDPRNDENLIISQFHHAFLRVHNQVVDALMAAGFTGDIFVEAKRLVRHHYQWAVVNDFLARVCGQVVVNKALATVKAPIGSPFRMPVEFAVAAYRFGHSMIRDNYWVNFNFPNATLGQIFEFVGKSRLPVFSNWVVDFNALFETGIPVPVNNKARKIDSVLANGLESLPGLTGMMQMLAQRNLRRGLALGLPSGQAVAKFFGVPALTSAQLKQGLPANEAAILDEQNGLLLKRTPLWYYTLREAMVLHAGERLGPVGGRIVAETFVRILKRDATSYLNLPGGFSPSLPSATAGEFTFADLVNFSGVTKP
jgi:hypothetical protein